MNRPWPTDLEFDRTARVLKISFDDGSGFSIPFELLRVESPSAEAQGHGPRGSAAPVLGKAHVSVTDAKPVGRYAVRIIFDDGHATGLYSWDFLHELGRDVHARMARYRARVEAIETDMQA